MMDVIHLSPSAQMSSWHESVPHSSDRKQDHWPTTAPIYYHGFHPRIGWWRQANLGSEVFWSPWAEEDFALSPLESINKKIPPIKLVEQRWTPPPEKRYTAPDHGLIWNFDRSLTSMSCISTKNFSFLLSPLLVLCPKIVAHSSPSI